MTRLRNYEMIYVWSTKRSLSSPRLHSPPPLLPPSNVHDDVYDNVISGNETLLEMLISRSLEIKIICTFERLSNFFFNKPCTHYFQVCSKTPTYG